MPLQIELLAVIARSVTPGVHSEQENTRELVVIWHWFFPFGDRL